MSTFTYENLLIHRTPSFPIIFHYDILDRKDDYFVFTHWHESIEILYIKEGKGAIYYDTEPISFEEGDIIVVNSNSLHAVKAITSVTSYYCLIIDPSLYENLGLDLSCLTFKPKLKDPVVQNYYEQIVAELETKESSYQLATKCFIVNLFIYLSRHYILDTTSSSSKKAPNKIELIKNAIEYIKLHYKEAITIEDICTHIGISKHYFCRTFKEVTGKTAIDYVNYLKCEDAKLLLQSGKYNVTEAGMLAGFNTLPYFCKTYKKYIGYPPSDELT